MRKKKKKINADGGGMSLSSEGKGRVFESRRVHHLPLPGRGQVIEIPEGYEVVERITCRDLVHKRTLYIRRIDASSFDIHLKSQRGKRQAESRRSPRARSA